MDIFLGILGLLMITGIIWLVIKVIVAILRWIYRIDERVELLKEIRDLLKNK